MLVSLKKWLGSFSVPDFYDGVEVGGSFTFYAYKDRVDDIYHILGLDEDSVVYQKTWYGYEVGKECTVSRSEFKSLVRGGEYHGKNYLYSL